MIELNEDLIKDYINKTEWNQCTEILKGKFKLNSEKKLQEPSNSALKFIVEILNESKKFFETKEELCNDLLIFLKQCFQSLRNSVSYSIDKQNYLLQNKLILDITEYYINAFLLRDNDLIYDCLKMILQFLINMVVNNSEAQLQIWNKFSSFIIPLLNHQKLSFLCAALVFNILSKNVDLIPISNKTFFDLIFEIYQSEEEEIFYHNQIMELLITNNYFTSSYDNFEVENRIILLHVVKSMLLLIEDAEQQIPHNFLETLSFQFKQKSDCILKTVTDYLKQIEPTEVSLLLDCLASASAKAQYQSVLQKDKSLLINCIFLLKSIHSIGKIKTNNFSSIDKISEMSLVDEEVREHPGFGFKANLVRILGNLAWKHKENQNELREMDCIPLLLDCCKIDGRNPLIIQWSILTIRNVLENNAANQQVVREMQLQGVVNSGTLLEMGITLQCDGDNNKIGIVPLDAVKKQ